MRMRLVVASALLSLAASAQPDAASSELRALEDLPGVYLLVEEMPADALNAGVTPHRVRAAVEAALARAGVRILSTREFTRSASLSYLYVNINVQCDSKTCARSNRIQLSQAVTFHTGRRGIAAVWQSSHLGVGPRSSVREDVLTGARELTEAFAAAFLLANPPPPK